MEVSVSIDELMAILGSLYAENLVLKRRLAALEGQNTVSAETGKEQSE